MTDDLLGRVVGGRFRLDSLLGTGGMGAVYLATDTSNDARVAVKVIRETLAESKEAIARFEREVQATEALHHPNIVRFLGAGQDGGLRYLAMELLEGGTLKERIVSRGAIPWRETLPIMRGIAQALDAAHRAGLIHRDLKPENVFLAQDAPGMPPQVKLLDFGVAKHTALPDGMTMTGTGIIVGTPGFVAPEVVLHGVADDPRSDFYGLGATWFEMLTSYKPFTAATPFALAMRHLNETPPRPTELVPFAPIPPPVEALLGRLLAKAPEQRPADATALLRELAALEDASHTPLPTPGMRGIVAVEKTLTDLETPRPDAQALARARNTPMHAVTEGGVPAPTPTHASSSGLPQTGFMPLPEPPAQPIGGGLSRRTLLAGAGLTGVIVIGAVLLNARPKRRGRDRPDRDAVPRGSDAAGPSGRADAGSDAGSLTGSAAPGATDAGPPITDAGASAVSDAGPSEQDAGPRRRRPRRPDGSDRPQLDLRGFEPQKR